MDGLGKIFALIWLIITAVYSYYFYLLGITIKKNRIWYSFLGFLAGVVTMIFLILAIMGFEEFILRDQFNFIISDNQSARLINMALAICTSIVVLITLKNVFFKKIINRQPKSEIDDIGN